MKGKEKMNKTLNLENTKIEKKTDMQIFAERIAKLEEAVFKPCMEEDAGTNNAIIIKNADRQLYAKVCALCLNEDNVNVIYKEGDKEKARACFENEMKPIGIYEYLESTYDLSVRSANVLTRAYQSLYNTWEAPKTEIEKWLKRLLENDGKKLAMVRNLGRKNFKEIMEKVGNRK